MIIYEKNNCYNNIHNLFVKPIILGIDIDLFQKIILDYDVKFH